MVLRIDNYVKPSGHSFNYHEANRSKIIEGIEVYTYVDKEMIIFTMIEIHYTKIPVRH